MDGKEFVKQLLSRKFAIAGIGILALCWIASIAPGQVALDENAAVSIVPMPKVPAAEQPFDYLRLAVIVGIILITCLTVTIQGRLDYIKLRDKRIFDVDLQKINPPVELESQN